MVGDMNHEVGRGNVGWDIKTKQKINYKINEKNVNEAIWAKISTFHIHEC